MKSLAIIFCVMCFPFCLSVFWQIENMTYLCNPEESICTSNIRILIATSLFIFVGFLSVVLATRKSKWFWAVSCIFVIYAILLVIVDIDAFGSVPISDVYKIKLRGIGLWIEEGNLFRLIFSVTKDILNPVLILISIGFLSRKLYQQAKQ